MYFVNVKQSGIENSTEKPLSKPCNRKFLWCWGRL